MILAAYIDESYRAGHEFVFGGFIATPDSWRRFVPEWEECCRHYGRKNHKTDQYHFHFKDMAQFPDFRANIPKFMEVIERHVLAAVSLHMDEGEFETAKQRLHIPGVPIDFGPLGHVYRMAFRCFMDKFHNSRYVFEAAIPIQCKVDFVFDEQMHIKKAIQSAWAEYIESREPEHRATYGTIPQWEKDEEFLPLQAADLWAGALRRAYKEGRALAGC